MRLSVAHLAHLAHLAQRSLRARLLAVTVLLVALALAIAGVGFERSARKVIMEAVGNHLAARAQEVLDATSRFQAERCTAVRNWAEADAMQGTLDTGDPKFAEDYLRRTIQDQGGGFATAALLDTRAQIRVAVRVAGEGMRRGDALEQLHGRSVAGLEPVALVLQGQPLSVALAPGSVLDPSDTGGVMLFVAVPVKDFAGDVVGAVVAAVPPAALSGLLSEIGGEDRRYLPVVADGAGQVVLSLPGVRRGRIEPLVLAGREGGLERRTDGDGEPVLLVRTAAAPAPPGWRALMLVDEREAYDALRTLRRSLAGFFVLVLGAAALASVVALRRAAQPLSDVSASMARVSGGDLTTRLPEVYADDLGHLVRSFNVMVTEVARSREELKRTEALQKEMQIAQQIQTAILPAKPSVPGFDIAARMKMADDVGGDLYDILAFEGTFWVLIGDVSGHGINSGLVMMMAQAAAYAAITEDPLRRPRDVIATVNRVIHENVRRRMSRDDYVTLMVARHLGDGRFEAAGAHQPIFIARRGRGVEVVEPAGPWVGVVREVAPYLVEYGFHLEQGDSLCLITDGIVEAKDGLEELFGEERLALVLGATSRSRDAAQTLSDIFASVEGFAAAQDDDMTAIVIQRKIHAN